MTFKSAPNSLDVFVLQQRHSYLDLHIRSARYRLASNHEKCGMDGTILYVMTIKPYNRRHARVLRYDRSEALCNGGVCNALSVSHISNSFFSVLVQ